MKVTRLALIALLVSVVATSLRAQDYKVDPTFSPSFSMFDRVQVAIVLPDGKLLIGGAVCTGWGTSTCTPMARRLNPDGSVDPTFNATFGKFPQLSSYIGTIDILPDGKIFLSGRLSVATVPTNYVRLNADGSVDTTMALGTVGFSYNPKFQRMPDGRYVGCGERTINSQLYDVVHALNPDGSPDPTFRVTFTDGFCKDIEVLPTGKILLSLGTDFGQTEVKQLVRLNSDGSQDLSFDADIPVSSYIWRIGEVSSLSDGKILMTYSYPGTSDASFRRLSANGATEMIYPLCSGGAYLVQPNGDMLASGCKRWNGTNYRLNIARVFSDGSVDPKLDNVFFDGGAYGLRETGNGKLYAFGAFQSTQFDVSRKHLVRLMPDNAPPKAKFDFDGDGRSDLAIFRPGDRTWYIKQSSEGFRYMPWGFSTDALAAGHFDGDGKTDIGIFRDGTLHAHSPAFSHRQIFIGQSGDRPILGNFEDNYGNLGDFMVRGVRSGAVQWFFRDGNTAATPIGNHFSFTLPGETATDTPVVGDFNGDSREEVGYFRNGVWYTSDYGSIQAPQSIQWGSAGDIPVPGDYDGDRQADYAVFRPSSGEWWIRRSTAGIFVIRFGQNGDVPVPADYDGDGKVDVAIFRNGEWWQFRMGTGSVYVDQWGIAGDKPIPAQMQ